MKANVSRLLIRNEELKGTNEYNKMHMECYAITNGKKHFIGWSIPSNAQYDVKGWKDTIKLVYNDYEYILAARHMQYIDFIE